MERCGDGHQDAAARSKSGEVPVAFASCAVVHGQAVIAERNEGGPAGGDASEAEDAACARSVLAAGIAREMEPGWDERLVKADTGTSGYQSVGKLHKTN